MKNSDDKYSGGEQKTEREGLANDSSATLLLRNRLNLKKSFPTPPKKSDEIAGLLKSIKEQPAINVKDVDLGIVPNYQGQLINERTGITTNGFRKMISQEAFSHTIKQHGDDKEQSRRGQKGVEDYDFQQIPSILVSPDNITYGGKNKFEQDVILFIKQINGLTYFVAMSVRVKKQELSLSTMYIKR